MKHYSKIEINPEIMCGKPVIRGSRITVELILKKLSEGLTPAEIAADHPTIKVVDIYMAQAYAADIVAGEEIFFAESA
ncbi:MAG: DUF433 domain-containing protein [bacterium]|nr:DUF433 domain-containing protein [bacterium]